jgi:hypothetical protein
MDITSSDPRDSLSVPSVKCQSLLGKALQEHFTKIDQIASVFSSSPSLQNSSAGANFLTNFRLDEKSAKLFDTVFTPEDCFSIQFTPHLSLINHNSEFKTIFSFVQKLITKNQQKYFEASLRTLVIVSSYISDEQLHFIVSNLKRINNFTLITRNGCNINSWGLSSIAENLSEVTYLAICSCGGVDTSSLELFVTKLKKLKSLSIEECASVNDDSIDAMSKIESSITSLSLLGCWGISPRGFNHVARMMNKLRELNVGTTAFDNENLRQICSSKISAPSFRRLAIGNCHVTEVGMTYLKSLENLEFLNVGGGNNIHRAEGINGICCLKNLIALDISGARFLHDFGVGTICSSLSLQKLNLSSCILLSDETLENLKQLRQLQDLAIVNNVFSVQATYGFLKETKSRLKRFQCSGKSACAHDAFVEPPRKHLDWQCLTNDDEVSFLVQVLGNDRCKNVEEIDLSNSQSSITEAIVTLILTKMCNLTKVKLESCSKINFENFSLEKIRGHCTDNNNHSADVTTIPLLSDLDVSSSSSLNDAGLKKIVSSFTNLRFLSLSYSSKLTEVSLQNLKQLPFLENLHIFGLAFSTSSVHSFVMSRRATLKLLNLWTCYAEFATDFLSAPRKTVLLNWSRSFFRPSIADEEVACLLELVGDDVEITEIDLGNNENLTKASLDLISQRCRLLKKINLQNCNLCSSAIEKFKRMVPNCEVLF